MNARSSRTHSVRRFASITALVVLSSVPGCQEKYEFLDSPDEEATKYPGFVVIENQDYPAPRILAEHAGALDDIEVVELPPTTPQHVQDAEDMLHPGLSLLGINHKILVNPMVHGSWTRLRKGGHLWRLILRSPGAGFLVPAFGQFRLDQGYMHVMSLDGCMVETYGPEHVRPEGSLWTPPIDGDSVLIELYWPDEPADNPPPIAINTLTHGLGPIGNALAEHDEDTEFRSHGIDPSSVCGLDVNCDQGSTTQVIKKGVVFIAVSSTNFNGASGSFINNQRQDCKRYLLTAEHVVPAAISVSSATFYHGFERSGCGSGSAPTTIRTTGAALRARWQNNNTCGSNAVATDFSLLEVNALPVGVEARMNGWSRSTSTAGPSYSMNHPNHQPKELQVDEHNRSVLGSYMWRTSGYENGGTRSGSSGGPLFNNAGRIIGQLCGGTTGNLCGPQDTQLDGWGALFASWNGGGIGKRLSPFLDPDQTGVVSIAGKSCWGSIIITATIGSPDLDVVSEYGADGLIPGEMARISAKILVRSSAPRRLGEVGFSLQTPHPNVHVVREAPLPTLESEEHSRRHFEVSVDPNAICGEVVPFIVVLDSPESDTPLHLDTDLRIGRQVRDKLQWAPGFVAHGGWSGSEHAASGDGVRHVAGDRSDAVLTTPVVYVPGNAVLVFEHRYETENFYDGGVLEYRRDGQDWVDAGELLRDGRYPSTVSGKALSSIAGRDAWAGHSNGWQRVEADLSSLTGTEVQFRWRSASDESVSGSVWDIRNARIETVTWRCG